MLLTISEHMWTKGWSYSKHDSTLFNSRLLTLFVVSGRSKFSKTIYPRGKGPTQELYSSSRRTAVVPLFKNYMQLFLVIFLGWAMLPHPQATSTDHGGPRTSDLSIERRRRNHFTTAPQSKTKLNWIWFILVLLKPSFDGVK